MAHDDALSNALIRTNETSNVDFKSSFDAGSNRDWLEITKDIIAFANSGGGYILVGVDDDGQPSNSDVSKLLTTDPADLANRIHKYTAQHYTGVDFIECEKDSHKICAIRISSARIPIVFTRVGEFELPDAKKKTVFALGTVYFRHGAKSEPGTSDDLREFLERELELTRKSWLDGIRKVVEAPYGSRFAVLPPEDAPTGPAGSIPVQLTSDPNAPAYYAVPLDKTHPFRQKEVIQQVNAKLPDNKKINSHDIISIRRVHNVQKDINLCYMQKYASPRYSQNFVDWIVSQYNSDSSFFEKTRLEFEKLKTVA